MALVMKHAVDPREAILKDVGDLSSVEIFNNQILVAIYIRPEKTSGGVLLPNQTRDEDKWQGKMGLVLKKGPSAFVDESQNWFNGVDVAVGDWVFFRPSDGWGLEVNGVLCRLLDDTVIRGRTPGPDMIW
jgi:co-chaperonin GroES (HSP10)